MCTSDGIKAIFFENPHTALLSRTIRSRAHNPVVVVIAAAIELDRLSVDEKLNQMEAVQKETRQRMDEHIYMDDRRTADIHRVQILRFNRELLQDLPHTHEDFIEAINDVAAK